ncbi:MAG TPA: hypothetical protein VGV59_11615 [Pyrinomonadaceae bacterium]|nr:hypothetical protein [Pyrinomonadaceae bacterium]
MRLRRHTFVLSLVLLGTLFLTACPNRTNISKILNDPDRYRNKEVAIAGNVTDSYGVPFVGGAYKVDDGTGSIWVINRRGSVPRRGAQVGAKGRIHSGVTFGSRNFGTVMEESEHRTK